MKCVYILCKILENFIHSQLKMFQPISIMILWLLLQILIVDTHKCVWTVTIEVSLQAFSGFRVFTRINLLPITHFLSWSSSLTV